MCDHSPNREAAMTVIERDADGIPTVWCDPCIAPLVKALNDGGLRTVASCCGHGSMAGRISLEGGRELIVTDFAGASDYFGIELAEGDIMSMKRSDLWTLAGCDRDHIRLDHGDRCYAPASASELQALGYVRLDGVDVEELRRVMADPERLVREPSISDWCVLADTAQIVLAALAEPE